MSKELSEHASKWSFARFQKKNPHAEPTQLKRVTVGDVWMYNVAILRALQKDYESITHRSIFARHMTHQTFCDFSIFQVLNRLHLQDHRATLGQVIHVSWWVHRLNCNVFITSPGCRSQLLSLRRVLDFSAVWFGVWMHFWQVNDQFDALCSMGVIHQNVGWHRCGWLFDGDEFQESFANFVILVTLHWRGGNFPYLM